MVVVGRVCLDARSEWRKRRTYRFERAAGNERESGLDTCTTFRVQAVGNQSRSITHGIRHQETLASGTADRISAVVHDR